MLRRNLHGIRNKVTPWGSQTHTGVSKQKDVIVESARGGIDAMKLGCLLLQFRAYPSLSHYVVHTLRFKIIAFGRLSR